MPLRQNHVTNIYMNASFHKDGSFGPINYSSSAIFFIVVPIQTRRDSDHDNVLEL
jgi:hypothetical protein